jgi:4-diphosphocytidyl-2-C-methyl-D-erythritol kinase
MTTRSVVLRPTAKINLTLRVGPKRADGYHDVQTLLQSIALGDTITFTRRSGPLALQSRAPGIPTDRTNLVWRAAEVLWKAAGKAGEPRDVHVRLEKQIPAAAGLGGGSADAAAALVGLNEVWDLRRPLRDLIRMAAELGSDVPFFLVGGTALATGRGEQVYPVDDIERFGVVIIKPSFGVGTADAYGWLDEDRESGADTGLKAPQGRTSRALEVGWPTGPIEMINDLEAPVARRHPAIGEMISACFREGAQMAAMTGSGSAVFGLFPESGAKRAVPRLQRPDWLVVLTRTLTRKEAQRRAAK